MTKTLSLALLLSPSLAAWAASDDALRALLAQDRRDYETVRVRREKLLAEIADATRDVEKGAGPDKSAWASELAIKDAALADKEAILASLMQRARDLRRSIAERELELALGGSPDADGGALEGTFTLTFEGAPEGRLKVVQTGALLSGSYELGAFSRGTFFGNGGSGKVVLTLIDEQGELFAVLKGASAGPTISGTWVRGDLASGTPSQGTWSARKGR